MGWLSFSALVVVANVYTIIMPPNMRPISPLPLTSKKLFRYPWAVLSDQNQAFLFLLHRLPIEIITKKNRAEKKKPVTSCGFLYNVISCTPCPTSQRQNIHPHKISLEDLPKQHD